ncbi:MAG: response regulator [Nitrospirota bacterium]
MIISCDCSAKLRIADDKITARNMKVRCPRCGSIVSIKTGDNAHPLSHIPAAQSTGFRVLVADNNTVTKAMVANVLQGAGFLVDTASDGTETLKKAAERQPHGIVLDVGLPGIYGFDLCSRLKENPKTGAIKIILVSSVYDMKRYRRTPESLYGADDYIEKHQLYELPDKLRALFSAEKPVSLPIRKFSPRTESLYSEHDFFHQHEYGTPLFDESDPDAVQKAKRLARIIVSDITLYNQEIVMKGLQNNTFFELLKQDIEEGRALYEQRIPLSIRLKKDYYQEAFDHFIVNSKNQYK